MGIIEHIKTKHLIFDGAMGTMLQNKGIYGLSDILNITNKEAIIDIHQQYVQSGSNAITTNTFSCNRYKIKDYSVEQIIKAAINNAKKANPDYVVYGVGPIGQLLSPLGSLTFDEAYETFKQQVIAAKNEGVDAILFETFSSLMELKIGILAAKENSDLPIFTTMTFQDNGRTFVGCDPRSFVTTVCGLGVNAVGVNCSLGPDQLLPVVQEIIKYSTVPVMVQANAGLPDMNNNYSCKSKDYSMHCKIMSDMGVRIIGGCCGTTPEYITSLKNSIGDLVFPTPAIGTCICSGQSTVDFDNKINAIGERINPTGKPLLKQALREDDFDYIVKEALSQMEHGATILDVNVGLPEIDEVLALKKAVEKIQSCCALPLQIDSTNPKAVELAVRHYEGKPLINSVNGEEESMKNVFPIAKKYGACVLGLCLDKQGIPDSVEKRVAIAKKILDTALSYGIPKENILIDCLVLTASAQQDQVQITLDAIKEIKRTLGLKCILGVSNVSFGLPNRSILNSVFLASAFGCGLDAPIINPLDENIMDVISCFRVISNEDLNATNYIQRFANEQQKSSAAITNDNTTDLTTCIIKGLKDLTPNIVKEMLKEKDPMEIINSYFIPALNEVGSLYNDQKIFLPQLMQSASAVKNGFDVIASTCEQTVKNDKVIIATVKGDVHDIGKNIVKMLLSNYGFDVIDLGKDVDINIVVDAIKKHKPKLVGLSALMTTTVENMRLTIEAIRENKLDCKVVVGGAVLNEEYASMVGATFYAKDAQETVRIANEIYNR